MNKWFLSRIFEVINWTTWITLGQLHSTRFVKHWLYSRRNFQVALFRETVISNDCQDSLKPLEFFLSMGYVKGRVYRNGFKTILGLKAQIIRVCAIEYLIDIYHKGVTLSTTKKCSFDWYYTLCINILPCTFIINKNIFLWYIIFVFN